MRTMEIAATFVFLVQLHQLAMHVDVQLAW